jgi:WD40 repeat protein
LEALVIDSAGRRLFVGDEDGRLIRYDVGSDGGVANGTVLGTHEVAACNAIALAQDGAYVVTGSFDTTARLWEFSPDGKDVKYLTLSGKSGAVKSVAVSPDGKWIAVGTAEGPVFLWDAARCRMILRASGGDVRRSKPPLPTTALRNTNGKAAL